MLLKDCDWKLKSEGKFKIVLYIVYIILTIIYIYYFI